MVEFIVIIIIITLARDYPVRSQLDGKRPASTVLVRIVSHSTNEQFFNEMFNSVLKDRYN